jgi:hypothetical protein
MGELHSAVKGGPDLVESPTYAQEEVLERAVTKLVLLGKQVGVGPDQMILLLESGMSVVGLVEYLAARNERRRSD